MQIIKFHYCALSTELYGFTNRKIQILCSNFNRIFQISAVQWKSTLNRAANAFTIQCFRISISRKTEKLDSEILDILNIICAKNGIISVLRIHRIRYIFVLSSRLLSVNLSEHIYYFHRIILVHNKKVHLFYLSQRFVSHLRINCLQLS